VLHAVLLGLAALAAFPMLIFSLQVLLALLPQPRRPKIRPEGDAVRAVVLIPAHNESLGLRRTLQSVRRALSEQQTILVVADNCSDDTADIARAEGVWVVERQDLNHRGKQYALAHGVACLAADPPDVVLILDADCEVDPRLVQRLVTEVQTTGQPAQAYYRFRAPGDSGSMNAVAELALQFRGYVRPRGAARLGTPCMLYGSGMAFPWSALERVPLSGNHLVEDMQYGIALMRAGYRPRFCADVAVQSELPRTEAGFTSQRTRWEQGHLHTLVTQTPRLLWAAIVHRDVRLVWAACDLLVPPLALLVLTWLLVFTLAAAAARSGLSVVPLGMLAVSGGVFAWAVLVGWWVFLRHQIPLTTLLASPGYVLRKVPLYWRMLVRPQHQWIRTARDLPTP
jgi:cellulose synthase/poly-beta-1,6-N-acetylglucosamine synthase-like glycosyltransferase